jgi:hypothetical protein
VLTPHDEFPELTRSIDQTVPADVRAGMRPAALVGSRPESAWCMARPGDAYLVYNMAGGPVELDLSADGGTFVVSWLGAGAAPPAEPPQRLRGSRVVTLAPPDSRDGRPWVAWLSRAR